jgi:hypothetical protein
MHGSFCSDSRVFRGWKLIIIIIIIIIIIKDESLSNSSFKEWKLMLTNKRFCYFQLGAESEY